MNEENTRRLIDEFPELWKHHNDLRASLMGFGFEIGDGWFELVYELCIAINTEVNNMLPERKSDFYVTQVKEKFGGLRFYTTWETHTIGKLICDAEDKSYKICEICGDVGKLMINGRWYKTLCKKHADESGYTDIQSKGKE